MQNPNFVAIAASGVIAASGGIAANAFAQSAPAPYATPPYQLSVFASAPSGSSAPDSIAVLRDHVFVGYGDGNAPDGSDGKSTQIVEYSHGRQSGVYVHGEGPQRWAEGRSLDAPALGDAKRRCQSPTSSSSIRELTSKLYTFGPTLHGGGYDDIVFRGCKVYISASNPANNPNTGPAIVSAALEGTRRGEARARRRRQALDVPTDATVKLNLQDPDSMTLDPLGNIVLDSQADQQLIYVSNPGEPNHASAAAARLSDPSGLAGRGRRHRVCHFNRGVYPLCRQEPQQGLPLEKARLRPRHGVHGRGRWPFVGTIDLTSGVITPIVICLSGPGGMVFVDTTKRDHEREMEEESSCRDREWDSH